MEPKGFLDLAGRLLKDIKSEASFRTCVSRSYFALYNLAATFIRVNFPAILTQNVDDHKNVYEYLNNCGVEDIKVIARHLNSLRDKRNDADYKLDLDRFDENCATMAFIQARSAIKGFEEALRNAKGRQHIIQGIESYKKIRNP